MTESIAADKKTTRMMTKTGVVTARRAVADLFFHDEMRSRATAAVDEAWPTTAVMTPASPPTDAR
jgi:hypothetical protein